MPVSCQDSRACVALFHTNLLAHCGGNHSRPPCKYKVKHSNVFCISATAPAQKQIFQIRFSFHWSSLLLGSATPARFVSILFVSLLRCHCLASPCQKRAASGLACSAMPKRTGAQRFCSVLFWAGRRSEARRGSQTRIAIQFSALRLCFGLPLLALRSKQCKAAVA